MILGYWDIRGRAHAIRLLLAYTDSHYEGKKYTMGDALDYDRSQWLDEKFKLGLDFPNLPYLIDGAHNIILCYIARKHNLLWTEGGETEEEMIHVDILENQATDASNRLTRVCYSPDFERLKPVYLESIPGEMKLYSQFLGKRPWFAGEKIPCLDCLAYDILDLHCIFEPKSLDAFPNLKEFIARIEGLKKISAYMKSSRFLLPSSVSKDRLLGQQVGLHGAFQGGWSYWNTFMCVARAVIL